MYKTLLFSMLLFQTILSTAQVKTVKNINYAGNADEVNTLNLYYKNDGIKNKPVLVFIHGGSWSSGKKETYWWLGRNFARKGVVTVIINYPLAPTAEYDKMALDCALAVKWVKNCIGDYLGNTNNITLMGHSAGAHLAELINADPYYFKKVGIENPISALVLNDPFGLDMFEYLSEAEKDHYYFDFLRTFTDKPEIWKKASPLNYVSQIQNPHLLFYGGKTYEAIKIQTPRLYKELNTMKVPVQIKEVKGKSHVPMITQMIFGGNDLYKEILQFINQRV